MKLIVQIPALNEEETLATAIAAIPRDIPGVSSVEILVIDDGSTDRTVEVAREAGVDHILQMPSNVGLARAFSAGIEEALGLGADIIVNTDADNQYCADDIPALIQPILDRRAQIVVGARPITEIESFSPVKKALQRLGSWGGPVGQWINHTRCTVWVSSLRPRGGSAALRHQHLYLYA